MKNETFIVVLIDRSGSMSSIKDDVIGGYNTFIEEQRKVGDNAVLTLVQFDTGGIDTLHEMLPIGEVPYLTSDTFSPRGGTPLLDAMGQIIDAAGKQLAAIPLSNRPDKVVFVVITDGQENASHNFTKKDIRKKVSLQEKSYDWNFCFLGANLNSVDEARDLGMANLGSTGNFRPNSSSVVAMYANVSSNIANYRGSSMKSDLIFTKEQLKQMDTE